MLEQVLIELLFSQSPLCMGVVSVPDYRYEMVNPAEMRFYESLGVTEVIGKRWVDLWKSTAYHKLLDVLDEVARTGKPRAFINMPIEAVVHGKPMTMYSSFIYYPIRGQSGSIEHIVWVGDDTTVEVASEGGQRLQAATLLKAEQKAAEWGVLINSSHEAIFMADEHGLLLEANPRWHQLSDILTGGMVQTASDFPHLLVTMPDGRSIPPEERPTARALRGEEVVNFSYRVVGVNGHTFELLHNATAVQTPDGKKVFSIITDITELRRLERLKDEFMLVVSHELRNPLQVILGQAQLVSLKMKPEVRSVLGSNIESLTAQARLLGSLVDDLLNAYRVGSGRLTVNMMPVDFRQVVLQALEAQITDTDHEWQASLGDSRVGILADAQRLGQAITNLLSNARKYTPVGGHIWLKLSTDKEAALLTVEDDGQGIPPEDLDKVFQGFYRTPDVAKWQSGSIGLGLFISRSLTRRMGGDLWAENRPGGGTAMCLKMPLAR